MSEAYSETAAGWAPAVRQRHKALLQRLGMGAATAMIFSPLFGLWLSTAWVCVYFLVQLLDLMIFAPITGKRQEQMGPLRSAAGSVVLFLNAASFGSLSIPLWLTGGPMGGVCAAILLTSGAIYAIVNSPQSAKVFALTITPQLIYLASTPLFMIANGADPSFVTAVAIAIVVFAAYCISTWKRIAQSYRAESAARIDAQNKRMEAERAMASRSAFLAAVAHDLRTPISAILAGASDIERTASPSTVRSNAALISDAGMMMKAMLDDLLDHSKLDAGRMTVEAADFNLRSLLAQTLRLWQGPIRAKGLTLRIEGAREAPAVVRGDAIRMRQILNNLLSNALKFTDQGAITVRVRAWPEEPTGHAILIEVADTGPGMTASQVARLFTPFDQVVDGVCAQYGGTGLGLAISRDLVELMGGRLTARSRRGEGARFTVSLLMAEALDARMPAVRTGQGPIGEGRGDVALALTATARLRSAATIPPPVGEPENPRLETEADPNAENEDDGRALRVLVVDDHEINRRAIELILTPLGCDIATAADGLAALKQCETGAFDVIFMDVRMPELDGRETTRRLRAGGGPNATAPVIAVTADTSAEDIAACMAAGMTYFVSKPLTPQALLGALNEVLNTGSAPQDAVAAA